MWQIGLALHVRVHTGMATRQAAQHTHTHKIGPPKWVGKQGTGAGSWSPVFVSVHFTLNVQALAVVW